MIWARGAIVPDDSLSIGVLDRTFEHGLGLFETLRTWGGRPALLPRHLDRLTRSARELGLPVDPAALPDADDVSRLLEAEGIRGDAGLRITLSGGLDDRTPGTLWMRPRPLPPPIPGPGARIRSTWIVPEDDPLCRFKSLNYWRRRLVFEAAKAEGFDEDLGRDRAGNLCEGSRSNVFAVRGGRLLTPSCRDRSGAARPLLPGIMRGVVLEVADRLGMEVVEAVEFPIELLEAADEIFLTNGGRGIVPVAEVGSRRMDEPARVRHDDAPGPRTRRLMAALDARLRSEDAR